MQHKVLIIEPDARMGEILTKNFEKEFGSLVTISVDPLKGLELLKGQPFDAVVVRNHLLDKETGKQLNLASVVLNGIYDHSLQVPVIVLGELEHSFKLKLFICQSMRIEELNRNFLKALGLKKEDFQHMKLPDYIPFSIKDFYLMNTSPCDVYIKLVKKTGEEYVKRLHSDDSFSKDDLVKYEKLGLAEFYIAKGDRENFVAALFAQTLESLSTSSGLDEAIGKTGDSFLISGNLIRTLGITPESITLVDETISNMRNQIAKSGKLGELLKKILDNEQSFSFKRSYLVCVLSHLLIPRMEWGGIDQQSSLFEKISLVSYFHDIYLEDEKLLKIMNHEQLKKASLSPRERDAILTHANHAALIVHNYPHLPTGVDVIIKQHHGSTNGVGFPEYLTTTISPMAIFFIVIEDFATLLLKENLQNIGGAVAELKERYQLPTYRKIVTEIEALIKHKQA